MEHPKTYKAFAFFEKGGDLKPMTFDWHDPEAGEVVVKVLACSVCAGWLGGRWTKAGLVGVEREMKRQMHTKTTKVKNTGFCRLCGMRGL